jgi:hypothetical protein
MEKDHKNAFTQADKQLEEAIANLEPYSDRTNQPNKINTETQATTTQTEALMEQLIQ